MALAAALVVSVPVIRGATSARASISTVQTVVIDGRGNGHGSGLSQWGALGWATQYDKTWEEILAIYYSGTTLGTLTAADYRNTPVGRITVQLTALNGRQTAVISESGALSTPSDPNGRRWSSLVAREVPGRNNVYTVWGRTTQACPAGDTPLDPGTPNDPSDPSDPGDTSTTVADSSTTTATTPATTESTLPASSAPDTSAPATSTPAPLPGWVRIASNVTGPITFTTEKVDQAGAVSPRDVIGVCQKNGSLRYYRGTILAVNGPSGSNFTFNSVLVDDYVRGVVPRESPASWAKLGGGKGMHALRAQAVAARSYAVAGRGRSSGAKICDTSACQVYGGTALRSRVGGRFTPLENAASNAAVADTANRVLRYANGGVAWATFSSSNGGRSITSLYQAIDDPGDAISSNPHHAWSITVPASKIISKWPALGSLVNIRVTQRTGGGVWNGWVDRIVLEGTKTNITVTGDQFRRALGLKSRYLNFNVLRTPDKQSIGPALFIGDSVAHGALLELKSVTAGAYSITWDTKLSRCLLARTGSCELNNAERSLREAATPAFAIVAVGHHDNPAVAGQAIDAAAIDRIMSAMLERGIARVLWVNLSERRRLPDGLPVFGPTNAALAEAAARWPHLTVLDWNAASSSTDASRWFLKGTAERPDLASLTRTGRSRFALFLRTSLDALRFDGLLPAAVNTVPITTVPTTTVPGSSTPDGSVPDTTAPTTSAPITTVPVTTTPSDATPSTTVPSTTSTTVFVNRPTLRLWARGENVRELQRALVRKGAVLRVDGVFGRGTLRAVRAFQSANRLKVDGIVGPRTWRKLQS